MLRPWSTKRVPWSKPDEYIVSRPAQASRNTAKAREPSKPWNMGAVRCAERGFVEDGGHGAGLSGGEFDRCRVRIRSRLRTAIAAIAQPADHARPHVAHRPTCSTCTASAPRRSPPRRARWPRASRSGIPRCTWWCPQLPPSPREAMDAGDARHRRLAARVDGGDRLLAGRLLRHLRGRRRPAAAPCCSIRPCTRRATWPRHIGEQTSWHDPGAALPLRAALRRRTARARTRRRCRSPSATSPSSPRATRCWTGAR